MWGSGKRGAVSRESDIPYDVLLIDLEWRGKDALEVARLAHSLRHRKRMPIVLLADTRLNRQAFIHNKEVAAKGGVQECMLKTQDIAKGIRRMMGGEKVKSEK